MPSTDHVTRRGAAHPAADSLDADGRRRRRDRNRDAVVDALLALFHEGELQPSSTQIAVRAGLSPRSLFRYFDDIDDLSQAAIERQQQRVWPIADVDIHPADPLASRIAAVVASRVELFEAIGNVGRVARLRAPFQPIVAAELERGRALLRAQLRAGFAHELAALAPERAAGVLATLDVLCSFESHQLLRFDQGLSRDAASSALGDALTALLAPTTPTTPTTTTTTTTTPAETDR